MPLSERFHFKTQKQCEAYRIGGLSCKQEANPIKGGATGWTGVDMSTPPYSG